MQPRSRLASLAVLLAAFLIAACSAATPISPSPSAPGTPNPSATPLPSDVPSSPPPSVAPTPEPTTPPSPKPPAAWGKPQLIADGSCYGHSFTIDSAGRYHVVAMCDQVIRYVTSANGQDWTTTDFAPPAERVEQGPLLAVDGDILHLAYSRLAPEEGGCGDDGLTDLGVYVRTRQLPDGAWSEPSRLGVEGDSLQAFRVSGGIRHLTVQAKTDEVFYQALSTGGSTRIQIPNAVATSLRVGDDGQARIAYTTGHTLRFGRIAGQRLTFETIAKTTDTYIYAPQLVLGAGNRPFVVWSQFRDAGGGCISIDPGPLDGTYFGTQGSGGWSTGRVSTSLGEASFTLDDAGRIHALINEQGVRYHTGDAGQDWALKRIPGMEHLAGGFIRIDPTDGTIAVLTVGVETGIYLVTKPAA